MLTGESLGATFEIFEFAIDIIYVGGIPVRHVLGQCMITRLRPF